MKKRWTLLIFPLLVALMLPAASARELPGNVLSFVLNSPDDAVLADDCRLSAVGRVRIADACADGRGL